MLSDNMALDTCFACKKQGHWAKDCPTKTPTKTSESKKEDTSRDIPVLYCPCGRGPCNILTSKTPKNPDRKFYTCPNSCPSEKKDCIFFKWVDELKVKVPHCPCGAGACSIQTVTSGSDKGKQFFACRIKKGHGACNFFQWVDSREEMDLNSPGKGNLSYSPTTSASSPIGTTASGLCKRRTLLANNPDKVTSVSSQMASTVSDLYGGGTSLASNLASAKLGSPQIISALANRASDSCNGSSLLANNMALDTLASSQIVSTLANTTSDSCNGGTLLASNSAPSMSTSCQITSTASNLCNGDIVLNIQPPRLLGGGNPQYISDKISVAEGMKRDSISRMASERLFPPGVVAPELVNSNFNKVVRDQRAEIHSSNLVMTKDLCSDQLESEAETYPQKTKFMRQNIDPKGSSTEVHSSIPSASSSRLRYPSSACGGCPQLVESQASRTPEYPGHSLHGCMNYGLSNPGHYMHSDEIRYGLVTCIEQLNRENGELKNENKNLKKQLAAYVEKETTRMPELRVEIADEKGFVYILCVVLILAVLVMCLPK